MDYYYDLHIHSGLSPCADDEMTPNNIINMSLLKELDIISVTDHNSMRNFISLKKIADEKGIFLLPGMEITSREEVHLLAYFDDFEKALIVEETVSRKLPRIKNNSKIFGNQFIYDINDNIIGEAEYLLMNAIDMSISQIIDLVKSNDGIVVPAHVNKKTNGIIGVLGFIPESYKFKTIEIFEKEREIFKDYNCLINSDAHYLRDISERKNFFRFDFKNVLMDINNNVT